MKLYTTTITAIDPYTGFLTKYTGPNVPGISFTDAQNYCDNNGLGYCQVDGVLISKIPCKPNGYEPDWNNKIDYDYENN